MSFEGFSDFEIQKVITSKTKKAEVKEAKNIQCHTKTKKLGNGRDKNQNVCKQEVTPEKESPELKFEVENQQNSNVDMKIPKYEKSDEFHEDKNGKFQDFELHRKLLEEQNRMKRKMLQEAISKFAEKTQAETKKIEEIRQALGALDAELSHDVSILRKEIETATLHFNTVEKQYISVEKMFLKAKKDLYLAHERKDMLTEHLCTIISHNEDRKAKKLSELMSKVGLTNDNCCSEINDLPLKETQSTL